MDQTDYDGAIVVVETAPGEIVLVHPGGGAEASLPGNPCLPGEPPAVGAVRIVRELTGLEVRVERELVRFVQEGTPTGTMLAHGYVATPVGGSLLEEGPEGPVATYRTDALPAMVPVRVAIRRVLETWSTGRDPGPTTPA